MLSKLYIKNIAVIKELTIDLIGGFNVFTGETGAGKTILISAINAVLGERTSKDIIRTGEDKAFVSALFTGISPAVSAQMEEMGFPLEEDEDLLISREINSEAKANCKINGRPATASILKLIAGELIAIHGQHDSAELMSPEKHMRFIDSFGELEGDIEAYKDVYEQMQTTKRELQALNMNQAEKARRTDLLDYQIGEITDAKLTDGEEEELLAEKKIIKNSGDILEGLSNSYSFLNGDGEVQGICDLLTDFASTLAIPAKYIDGFEAMSAKSQEMQFELQEYASQIRDYIDELEFDPNQLALIEERLDLIYRLKLKYGENIKEILEYLENAQTELDNITFSEEKIAALTAKYQRLLEEATALAQQLSTKRAEAGERFTKKIEQELFALDMPLVRLLVGCKEKPLSADGVDEIELLISTNAGEQPKPLAKIASGGEISRIMLAIKNVMADKEQIDTLIFDEIDTGVSGRSAGKIGIKLKQVSKNRQVICVTHLAQVSAYADNHLFIDKVVEDGHTFTKVKTLSYEERKYEIARIIGGENITDISLQNAEEMLKIAIDKG